MTRLLIAIVSVAVSLAASELALQLADKYRPLAYPPEHRMPEETFRLFERHDPYGYRLRPSTRAAYSYPPEAPRRLSVVSNRHGFRSRREFDEPDDRTRIVVLGDSFVFGEGVEERERFTDVLEAHAASAWRVDGLGMTGWGPDLMLRALEQVGLDLEPDVVVLCFYTHDFRRVHRFYAGIGFPIPRFELVDGELATVPYPRLSAWQRLRLYQLANPYWRIDVDAIWELHRALLDRLRALAASHRFRFAIVFLPGEHDPARDQERRRWLGRYAAEHDLPFLDLTQAIQGPERDEVFLPRNPHYNPGGHRIVAEQLGGFLRAAVLPGAGAP